MARFDLSLDLAERDGRIAGGVKYATSLFERATVERWLGYLRRVLEEMAADENRPVERLALLPERERARVLEEWNRTEAESRRACVHERFEAAGGAHARRGGGGLRRRGAHLRGAEPAGQPAGAPPPRAAAWGRTCGWGCAWSAAWR